MNDIEHDRIRLEIKGIIAQHNANYELLNIKLDNIGNNVNETLKQAVKTNGRVTKLEERTENLEAEMLVFRLLKKRKWLILTFALALLKLYEIVDIKFIYTWLKSFL